MREITEELIDRARGRPVLLSTKTIPNGHKYGFSILAALSIREATKESPESYYLDITHLAVKEFEDGEQRAIEIMRVDTGITPFKTADKVEEVKKALALLALKFDQEYYKLTSVISLETLNLRDEALESCL